MSEPLTPQEEEAFNALGGLMTQKSDTWEPAAMRATLDGEDVTAVVAVNRQGDSVEAIPMAIMVNNDLLARLEPSPEP